MTVEIMGIDMKKIYPDDYNLTRVTSTNSYVIQMMNKKYCTREIIDFDDHISSIERRERK